MTEESPFVGRPNELERLTRRLSEVRDGAARTVLVGGGPGLGKTRLLSEFLRGERLAGIHVLAGACEEHFGDPMPYGPLIEVLDNFGLEYGEGRATELGGPAYRKLTAFFDLGNDSMGVPLQVFLAVRRMLDHIATDAPVVLILEDLHWADPSTLDLVRHLAQTRAEDRRVLLVGTYRPVGRAHPLWQLFGGATFMRRTDRFELRPFTLDEMRELLGEVDRRLAERCLRLSDGIPFYAEQLMATGALAGGDEDIALPPDIRSMMLGRLSQLTEDAFRVLQTAAVAGRAMSRQLLHAVSGMPAETLRDALHECADHQMLSAGQGVYRFQHALLRETVLQETAPDVRVELHVAMAEALAADSRLCVTEGSAAAEQAIHWYQAGVWPQALTYAVAAGQAAARTLAFPSADLQFDRALRLWHRVEDAEARAGMPRFRLLAEAAAAARWSGRVDRAIELVEQAIDAPDHGGDPGQLGELHERRANYLAEAGRWADSAAAFREAARLLADRPPSAVQARVLAGIALAHLQAGRYEEGGKTADEALGMAIEVGAYAEEGRALNVSGLALGMRGDPEGEVRLRRSIEIARSVAHIEDLLRSYGNLGLILEHAGRLRDSAEVTRDGLDEARRLGLTDSRQSTIVANNASAALVLLGEWDDAERIITEAIQDLRPAESLYPRLTLAEIQVHRGDLRRARELLASIDDVEHGADPRFLGPLHAIRAELAIEEGDLTRAVAEVGRGLAAVRKGENTLELLRLCAVGMRCAADQEAADAGDGLALLAGEAVRRAPVAEETAQLARLLAAERRRIRRTDTARVWGQVADGWAALDRRFPAAYARWRQAEAALRAGERAGAREPARIAYQTATELGAAPLRDRVRTLARRADLDLGDRPVPARLPYQLTPAELNTLRLLYQGGDVARIASQRDVAKRTVETQLGRVYKKLGVHSAVEAITRAREEHFFD
ncbi:AAA family ATPase [Micromonospora sp. NPDC049151]|uniref:ATP-binding protein n=1 Tax=Micromonospora sp. NPDC049151 TaxID=3155648 RepID=UPI0033EEE845